MLDKLSILHVNMYVSYTGDKKTPKDTMFPASKSQSHHVGFLVTLCVYIYIYIHISKMVIIDICLHVCVPS